MSRPGISRRLKNVARSAVLAVGKHVPFVRTASRRMVAARNARAFQRMCSESPLEPKTVVFQCFAGRSYTCSPRAIYRAMLADPAYRDFEFVWAFREPVIAAMSSPGTTDDAEVGRRFGEDARKELSRAKVVEYGSAEHTRAMARAGTWVSNAILSAHFLPREGQTYLQTWHGTPLKRLGCDLRLDVKNATFEADEIHERYEYEGRRMTHLVSPSPFATEKLATAFCLPKLGMADKVIETGYPRNDFLKTFAPEDVDVLRVRLGIPEGKRVMLYAPTFRDDQHSSAVGYTYRTEVDFDRLRVELGDDWVILFRAHYLVANDFDFDRYAGFVHDVSDVNDINDLYVVSDVLTTDYSSVFFDFANLRRPMIFYMYDLERYAEELRGFYLDLAELPGPIVRTEEELIAAVRSAEQPSAERDEALERFGRRFNPLDDGHAAERVLEVLFGRTEAAPEIR